jgi:hypothetical protein
MAESHMLRSKHLQLGNDGDNARAQLDESVEPGLEVDVDESGDADNERVDDDEGVELEGNVLEKAKEHENKI